MKTKTRTRAKAKVKVKAKAKTKAKVKVKRTPKAKKIVIKMKKNKGLSKKEAQKYQRNLEGIRKNLIGEIEHLEKNNLKKSNREASGDLSGYRLHMADVASDAYEQEFALGIVSSENNLLREVENALNKIKEGNYGLCEDCGKRINAKRLKAIPYAHLCIDCKEKEELQGRI